MIYTRLLYEPQSPPSSPGDAGSRFAECNDRKGIFTVYLADERFPGHTHLNLLLCCRQINREFSQLLALKFPLRQYLDFTLDCMVMERALWPTWNVYPGLYTADIRTLRVDLRIWPMVNQSPNGCLRYLHRAISCLLNRFLHCGPRLTAPPPNPEGIHHDIHIDTLCINIFAERTTRLYLFNKFLFNMIEIFQNTLSRRIDELILTDNFAGNVAKLKLCYQNHVVEHEFEGKLIA